MFDFSKLGFTEEDLLVITDTQVDFVTGKLGNKDIQEIIPHIVELINVFPGTKVYTMDTHDENYPNTQEGRNLDIIHTVIGTEGWEIVPEIKCLITDRDLVVQKYGFGSKYLFHMLEGKHFRRIYFVGCDTGYCVITNAVSSKTADPEAEIYIIEPLCACATKETHDTAIKAMETMQIYIIRKEDMI